jgi:hypothetical protein
MADGRRCAGSVKPDKRGGLLKQEHMAVQVGMFVFLVLSASLAVVLRHFRALTIVSVLVTCLQIERK